MKILLLAAFLSLLTPSNVTAIPNEEATDTKVITEKQQTSKNLKTTPAPRNTPKKNGRGVSTNEIRKKTIKATVYIITKLNDEKFINSGFFVSPDGYILTNYHIMRHSPNLTIITEQKEEHIVRDIVWYSRKKDLALLKIEGENFPFLEIKPSRTIKEGSSAFTAGHSTDVRWKFHKGHVSKIKNKIFSLSFDITPELSGAPIVDDTGKVFAMAACIPIFGETTTKKHNLFRIDYIKTAKIGLPSEYFPKIPEGPDVDKMPMHMVVLTNDKITSTHLMAYMITKNQQQLNYLKKSFSEITLEEKKTYDKNHKMVNGSSKVLTTNIYIKNISKFNTILSNMNKLNTFFVPDCPISPEDKTLAEAKKHCRLTANKITESAQAITDLNGKPQSLVIEQRNKALAAYNEAISHMYKALININKSLKKRSKYMCKPIISVKKLARLQKTYSKGMQKLNKSDFGI